MLAGGCFWGMQDLIRKMDGVISTRVGYTGGDVPNATYRNHGTHAEAIEIVFDPARISYRKLLEFFFQIHDPTTRNRQGNDVGMSYRSAIYYTSDEQKRVAEDTIADVEASGLWPGKVVTEVAPAGPFWEAEPEHQDYLERIPNGYTCHFVRPGWKLPVRQTNGAQREREPLTTACAALDASYPFARAAKWSGPAERAVAGRDRRPAPARRSARAPAISSYGCAQRGEQALERAEVAVVGRCRERFLDAVVARDHPRVDAAHARGARRRGAPAAAAPSSSRAQRSRQRASQASGAADRRTARAAAPRRRPRHRRGAASRA